MLTAQQECDIAAKGKRFIPIKVKGQTRWIPADQAPYPKPVGKKQPKTHKPFKRRKKHRQKQIHRLPPPPIGWGSYSEYLASPYWKARAKLARQSAGFKCQRCGRRGGLQVHHKHYRTLGHEQYKDLEVLCRPCHMKQHEGLIAAENHLDAIWGIVR